MPFEMTARSNDLEMAPQTNVLTPNSDNRFARQWEFSR